MGKSIFWLFSTFICIANPAPIHENDALRNAVKELQRKSCHLNRGDFE